MHNIVVDMFGKFHNNRLKNDRALVHWKSDNNNPKNKHKNNNKNNGWPLVALIGDPFPGPKNKQTNKCLLNIVSLRHKSCGYRSQIMFMLKLLLVT